ncbi:MAG: hypothetical protein KatS3mg024_0644 [Armatimonadota bacterium]|nr:MAG: hypothetical protein KatS3mg024_0644 [Armatimonadota bacterium]
MHRRWHELLTAALLIILLIPLLRTAAVGVGTPAGTVIECVATARYTNQEGTLLGEAVSNTLQIVVGRKAAASFSPASQSVTGRPARVVSLPAEIRNLGNAEDQFRILLTAPSGWNGAVYLDENGDGVRQDTESQVLTQTPPLPPDSVLKVVVQVTVPENTRSGTAWSVELAARPLDTNAALATATYIVNATTVNTTIALSAEPANPEIGSLLRLTAQVEPPEEETVQLTVTGPDGTAQQHSLRSGTDGVATLDLTPDVSGAWSVTAVRPGTPGVPEARATLSFACRGPSHEIEGLDMISVPLQPLNPSVASLFGGQTPSALARWLPAEYRYALYNPFTGETSDPLLTSVVPGEAYWIGTPERRIIAPAGRLVDQTQPFRVRVYPGWNQIGSPFITDIDWRDTRVIYNGQSLTLAEARAAEVLLEYCWTFIKLPDAWGYELIHPTLPGARKVIQPWKGYWVFAGKEAEVELHPVGVASPPPAPASVGVAASDERLEEARSRGRDRRRQPRGPRLPTEPGLPDITPVPEHSGEWFISITATGGGMMDSDNFLGVSDDSSLDGIVNPPRGSRYVDVYFPTGGGAQHASDVRLPSSQGHTWEFEVATSAPGEQHSLRFYGVETVPFGVTLTLLDLQNGGRVDLRSCSEYFFTAPADGKPARFRVLAIPA